MCVPGAGAGDVPDGCCAVAIPQINAGINRVVAKRDIGLPETMKISSGRASTEAAALRQEELDAERQNQVISHWVIWRSKGE